MIKIALLLSDNLLPDAENTRPDREELVEQMGKLTPAFALQGLELVEVRWREIAERAAEFAAILPLMVWDYFEGNEAAFLMVECVTETNVTSAFEELDCETLVIKPQIGGGAWRQALYKKGDPFPDAQPRVKAARMKARRNSRTR